jgi:CheY-like chemotaxis protein
MKTAENNETGTVLIVDDDIEDIQLAQRVIAAAGPQLWIRAVLSGDELIAYLQAENGFHNRREYPYPFLILLDLKLPGRHGFEILQWLADHPPHNLIPVVVLTVSGEVELARRAYELGARSFLTKPLTINEFLNMMCKFDCHQKPAPKPKGQVKPGTENTLGPT